METVTSIAMLVELRDPYTHGHEGRVASLASAIALGALFDPVVVAACVHLFREKGYSFDFSRAD